MKTILKYASVAALTGAMALAAATPSQARYWHHGGGGAIAGFAAGALVGAAVANSYYGPGYYYAPDYGYAPGYAYAPGPYYDAYAYAPAPTYYSGRTYYRSNPGCSSSGSPASQNFGATC
jgi:hypothetical protein